jgi:hypothetical protein
MPETSVNKHSKPLLLKNKIWIAKQREAPTPALAAASPHQLGKQNFCGFISMRTNAGHEFGAFLFRNGVCHGVRKLFDFDAKRHIRFYFFQPAIVCVNDAAERVDKFRLFPA